MIKIRALPIVLAIALGCSGADKGGLTEPPPPPPPPPPPVSPTILPDSSNPKSWVLDADVTMRFNVTPGTSTCPSASTNDTGVDGTAYQNHSKIKSVTSQAVTVSVGNTIEIGHPTLTVTVTCKNGDAQSSIQITAPMVSPVLKLDSAVTTKETTSNGSILYTTTVYGQGFTYKDTATQQSEYAGTTCTIDTKSGGRGGLIWLSATKAYFNTSGGPGFSFAGTHTLYCSNPDPGATQDSLKYTAP